MTSGVNSSTEEQFVSREEFEPAEVQIDAAETWEGWETKLCLWSLGVGLAGLVILGALVNAFIL